MDSAIKKGEISGQEPGFPRIGARLLFLAMLLTACRTADPVANAAESEGARQGGAVPTGDDLPAKTAGAPLDPPGTPFEPSVAGGAFPGTTPLSPSSCSDSLIFMGDLTYPDQSRVLPAQPLEKRWKVRNGGLCDWGPEYRFRWVGGTALSSQQEFALFPAIAGSEAEVAVLLTAPVEPGRYISNWRAFTPQGVAFGDTLFIDFVVAA